MSILNLTRDYLEIYKQKLKEINSQTIHRFISIFIITIIVAAIIIYAVRIDAGPVNITHLFYIPILLSAYWWNRNAIFVILFVIIIRYLIYFMFFNTPIPAYLHFRSLLFLTVGIFAILVCDKKTKAEEGVRKINEDLEEIIEEQTHDLKQTNEKLQESEKRYRDIFENSTYIMYTYDSGGYFTEMNGAGIKTLGYTREQIKGTHISEYLTPQSHKAGMEYFDKLMSSGPVKYPITLEVNCQNRETKWLEITERAVRNSHEIVEIHGIARDISEKIKLKKELDKSNKLRKLMCYLIEGERGGRTRALILRKLADKPYNANQLAKILDMDYKTIRHHLDVLIKNGIIEKKKSEKYSHYYLSEPVEANIMDYIS